MADKNNISTFTFFCPGARVLNDNEISELSPEKKQAAEQTGNKGLWLEIKCPEGTCVDDSGRVMIPTAEAQVKGKKGIWLNLFCPEDSCEVHQSTEIPS
ncbi:MAG: hypothetical protein R6U27_09350 [Desulfobacterales bacterium]